MSYVYPTDIRDKFIRAFLTEHKKCYTIHINNSDTISNLPFKEIFSDNKIQCVSEKCKYLNSTNIGQIYLNSTNSFNSWI